MWPRVVLLCCLTWALLPPRASLAQAPDQVAAAFCESDGHGDRLRPAGWAAVADLVTWHLEPAWDHVVLIRGYQINPPRLVEDEVVVEVRYTRAGAVNGLGIISSDKDERVELRLSRESGVWRLLGPPPVPHLFENLVDEDEVAASMAPGGGFVSNSMFIWMMFADAGWDLPYRLVSSFLEGEILAPVAEPQVGDIVAYLDGGVPYHAGIYEGANRIVSATANRGTLRSRLNAFGGEVRYLRLGRVKRRAPQPASTLTSPESTPAISTTPSGAGMSEPPSGATPGAAVR